MMPAHVWRRGVLCGLWLAAAGGAACGGPSTPGGAAAPAASALARPPDLVGDQRVNAQCGTATVTAGPPRREYLTVDRSDDWACRAKYAVDITVETDAGEAMAFDFLRRYRIEDWKVATGGGRVRHDITVRWEVYEPRFMERGSLPGIRPMTIAVCPEGERGPVLACSDVSCDLYDDRDHVPEIFPRSMGVAWYSPWRSDDVQEMREGETLAIPLRYVVLRDPPRQSLTNLQYNRIESWASVTKRLARGTETDASADVEITPRQYDTAEGLWIRAGDEGTLTYWLTAIADDEEEEPELFRIDLNGRHRSGGGGAWCRNYPNHVHVRVFDAP